MEDQKFPKKLTKSFDYSFAVNQDGLYAIAITASCKSGRQIGDRGGEDLRVEIDGQKLREVPAKAMIYKESRMGYAASGFPDIMQGGDERNPAIHSIRGEKDFYANEFISETEIGHISYSYPKKYLPPKVESPSESIFWGVRWLYHKAQYLKQNTNKELAYPYVREWNFWQQAVIDYNGNPQLKYEYQKDIWKIYQEGIDPAGNILWQEKSFKE